jgi:hypothetical protein
MADPNACVWPGGGTGSCRRTTTVHRPSHRSNNNRCAENRLGPDAAQRSDCRRVGGHCSQALCVIALVLVVDPPSHRPRRSRRAGSSYICESRSRREPRWRGWPGSLSAGVYMGRELICRRIRPNPRNVRHLDLGSSRSHRWLRSSRSEVFLGISDLPTFRPMLMNASLLPCGWLISSNQYPTPCCPLITARYVLMLIAMCSECRAQD